MTTQGQGQELILRAGNGDSDALRIAVDMYRPLAERIARGYRIVGVDYEEKLSYAYEGLIKAIKSYRLGKGASFETYCNRIISRTLIDVTRKVKRQVSTGEIEDWESVESMDRVDVTIELQIERMIAAWADEVMAPIMACYIREKMPLCYTAVYRFIRHGKPLVVGGSLGSSIFMHELVDEARYPCCLLGTLVLERAAQGQTAAEISRGLGCTARLVLLILKSFRSSAYVAVDEIASA